MTPTPPEAKPLLGTRNRVRGLGFGLIEYRLLKMKTPSCYIILAPLVHSSPDISIGISSSQPASRYMYLNVSSDKESMLTLYAGM